MIHIAKNVRIKTSGFTLFEILLVIAISGVLMLSLGSVVGNVAHVKENLQQNHALEEEAAFVMRRIVQIVSRSNTIDMKKNTANEIHYDFNFDPQRDMDKDGFIDSDDDQDGQADEDQSGDMNGDGESGIAGVDDDGDGFIDEENKDDDDEDGTKDEDKPAILHIKWKDGVFEQEQKIFDLDGDGKIDNSDKMITILSENITSFIVTTPAQTGRYALFNVSLTLTDATGDTTSLSTSIRVGGRL